MQIFRSLEDVPSDFGPTVVSVGNFDGVHRAHQEVVRHMAERARTIGGKAVVVTFEPHPLRILRPDVAPKLLTPSAGQARTAGADPCGRRAGAAVHARSVDDERGGFCATECWRRALHAREVHEGYNFHFGHKAQGNVDTLAELGKQCGFEATDLSRADAARTSRFQQRDSQADCRGKCQPRAGVAGPAVQHLLQSRARPRLRPQVHRADGEPGTLRRTGSRRRRLHHVAADQR